MWLPRGQPSLTRHRLHLAVRRGACVGRVCHTRAPCRARGADAPSPLRAGRRRAARTCATPIVAGCGSTRPTAVEATAFVSMLHVFSFLILQFFEADLRSIMLRFLDFRSIALLQRSKKHVEFQAKHKGSAASGQRFRHVRLDI